jgi:hypothetical protein
MSGYDIGDRRKLSCEIRDETGVLIDPTTLLFKMYEPDKTLTVFTYGEDNEVNNDGVGSYYVYWDITKAGTHWWRYEATGNVGVAEEAKFLVRKSKLPLDLGS